MGWEKIRELATKTPPKLLRSVSELEKEFEAVLISIEIRPDKTGRECLFVRIEGDTFWTVQKYTPSLIPVFYQFLVNAIGEDISKAEGKRFKWQSFPSPRGYPRYYPVMLVEQKEKEKQTE